MSIYAQVISSGKIVCEVIYFFPININSHYYVLQNKIHEHNFSLKKITNGNEMVICYYWNDVVPQCLRSISQSDYNNFPPLHISMKENDITMDENNRR